MGQGAMCPPPGCQHHSQGLRARPRVTSWSHYSPALCLWVSYWATCAPGFHLQTHRGYWEAQMGSACKPLAQLLAQMPTYQHHHCHQGVAMALVFPTSPYSPMPLLWPMGQR